MRRIQTEETDLQKLFGTDGIRGRANQHPMTIDTAMRLALSAGRLFLNPTDGRPKVVIGRDTRISGGMLEYALFAGFTSLGYHVLRAGVIPSPAVSLLTRQAGANLGVMISASHNKFFDNGLKLFKSDGTKLSATEEADIEQLMQTATESQAAAPKEIGFVTDFPNAHKQYVEFLVNQYTGNPLEGRTIVVDCAHGAGVTVAHEALSRLGAQLIPIGNAPDGININDEVGSTATERLSQVVVNRGADIGIALDGDADRVIIIDEKGQRVEGGQLLALIARDFSGKGRLKGGGIVSTSMANMGLGQYLQSIGLQLYRSGVGDKLVAEMMRDNGINVGGEPSGHIIFSDLCPTGDGLLAAMQVLGVLSNSQMPMSELGKVFQPAPQKLVNVKYSGASPLDQPSVKTALTQVETALGQRGRLVVRPSGTEPVIRVMVEATDETLLQNAIKQAVHSIEDAI